MPTTAIEAAKQIAPVMDLKAGLGIGVGAGSFFMWITQWLPVVGMVMTLVISVMTVIYLKKGFKIRDQDSIIRDQQIELNNLLLKRRADDQHDPLAD